MIDGCNNPSEQTSWRIDLADRLFAPPEAFTADELRSGQFLTNFDADIFQILEMEKWCHEVAYERLAAHGLVVEDRSRRKLVLPSEPQCNASLTLARLAKGKYSLPPLFPAHSKSAAPANTRPLTFKFLVDGWSTERRPVAKTVYEWSRVVR
jgi:hypothetical protein